MGEGNMGHLVARRVIAGTVTAYMDFEQVLHSLAIVHRLMLCHQRMARHQ